MEIKDFGNHYGFSESEMAIENAESSLNFRGHKIEFKNIIL